MISTRALAGLLVEGTPASCRIQFLQPTKCAGLLKLAVRQATVDQEIIQIKISYTV